MNKETDIKEVAAEKETVISPFAICRKEFKETCETIKANIGQAGLTASDLAKVKVPAGGGPAFTVQGLDGEEAAKEIIAIIAGWHDKRAYWSVPIDRSDGNMPPD